MCLKYAIELFNLGPCREVARPELAPHPIYSHRLIHLRTQGFKLSHCFLHRDAIDREMRESQSPPLWFHTSGAQRSLNALFRSACPPEQRKQNMLPCRSPVRGVIAEPAPGRSHWLPTLGCTFLLHRPCEHVHVYIYIYIYIFF